MTAWADLRAFLPGLRGQRIHVVPSSAEPFVREALAAAGFEVATLAGSGIRNDATFFEEVARALGFPEWFGRGWDALADALRDVELRRAPRQAIVWMDADHSASADLQTFVSALLAFEAAALDLADEDDDAPPRQLEVFVLGSGPGFAPGS